MKLLGCSQGFIGSKYVFLFLKTKQDMLNTFFFLNQHLYSAQCAGSFSLIPVNVEGEEVRAG